MEIEDFLGEEVVDRAGETVGTLECYWHAFDGKVCVLGIIVDDSTTTRLVPYRGVRLDERHSCLHIPFSRSKVQGAPPLECDEDLEAHDEEEMYRHYNLEAPESFGDLQIRRMTTG